MHSLLDPLERHAHARPDHLAACDPSVSLTYREFRAAAQALGRRLPVATQRPHVGVLAPTSATGAAAIYACWYAGKVPVPFNFMLAPPELAKIVCDADLDLVLCAAPLAALAQSLPVRVLPIDSERAVTVNIPVRAVNPSDLAVLLYTSGTLGEPKGACLTFDNVTRNAQACIEAAELTPDGVFLGLLPQFHAFGLTATTIVPVMLGATTQYLPRFSPTTVVNLIAEQHVTVFITIASMFGALAGLKDATRAHFSSLTYAVSGGEPLPARVAQTWEERFGVRLYEGYGMTEASPVVSLNTRRHYRRGSVGRPLPGITVQAVNRDAQPVPVNHDGELTVRGHCVMRGYLNRPELSAATVRDGVLFTGDIGHIDAAGFVYITGRAKEMLIVGGENVFPFEIESVLAQHPAIAEAAVIGVRDDLRGELPVAFAAPLPGVTAPSEAELRTFCRERLAPYKIPRRIYIETNLPRGPTGKILKRALVAPGL
jgi:long-chain acyl-CoA synthetase